jgi:hypothetical protein
MMLAVFYAVLGYGFANLSEGEESYKCTTGIVSRWTDLRYS